MTSALVAAFGAGAVVILGGWAIGDRPRRTVTRPGRRGPGVVEVALPATVVVVTAVVMGAAAALAASVALIAVRARLRRGTRARALREKDQALPDLIDLLAVAASSGASVPMCLASVAARAPDALRAPLLEAHRRTARGEALEDALTDAAADLGTLGSAVVDALISGHQTGAALAPALQRVAAAARDRRHRLAEEAARRLPVTLLFPLVCCVLPAFVLLAVVPLLAVSLDSVQR